MSDDTIQQASLVIDSDSCSVVSFPDASAPCSFADVSCPPMVLDTFPPLNTLRASAFLTEQGWPIGLQNSFLRDLERIAFRIFIIDDSGSMMANDGHRIMTMKTKTTEEKQKRSIVSSTRWHELVDSIKFHAAFAEEANAVTEFRFLNGPSFTLGLSYSDKKDKGDTYNLLLAQLDSSPTGSTPLCKHIREVIQEITALEPMLRANRQKVSLTIATDGESSDGNIAEAMRPLQSLPCIVVIRLCTDEDRICHYWNNVDHILELELDILDDLCSEAKEIKQVNPWLTYGTPLHQIREFGCTIKEIDLLDETRLSTEQILKVIRIM